MKNTCKKEFAPILWDEIMFGTFIEGKQISDDVMQSVDRDIESIMEELNNK